MKLTTIEVKGKKLEVGVWDNGQFYTELGNEQVHADSLEHLKTLCAKKLARAAVKLNIPFLRFDNGQLKRGTITGLHASNRNVLVKWEDGTSSQEYSYQSTDYIKPELVDEYVKLSQASFVAENALTKFTKLNNMDPKVEIRKQLGADTEVGEI
jgi:hypothetical protein